MKLNKHIYFRKFGDFVFLYDTNKQKFYKLNDSSFEILNILKNSINFEDLFLSLIKNKDIDDIQSLKENTKSFIDALITLDIVILDTEKYNFKNGYEEIEKDIYLSENKFLSSVMMELTYKCNEHCRHCYVVNDNKKELSTEEIKKVLDDLYINNILNIVFTGGEVFIRKDFREIYEYAISKGFLIEIYTNGNLMTNEDFLMLAKNKPRTVSLSVYGSNSKTHDYVTTIDGSFDKTIYAIKTLKDLGISVNIKCSVLDCNSNEMEDLIILAKKLGATIQIGLNLTPTNKGENTPFIYQEKNIEQNAKILKLINKYSGVNEIEGLELYKDETIICGAGQNSLSINPYGEVYPCNSLMIPLGNIKDKSIKDIFNCEALKQFRSYTKKELKDCTSCDLYKYCSFCPAISLMQNNGNMFKKYQEACDLAAARKLALDK